MNDTLDYIESLTQQTRLEELWDAHCAQMKKFGFDRIIYGYTNYRSGMTVGDTDDFFVLSNHDPNYLHRFINEGLYIDGPMFEWTMNNAGAASWSRAAEALENGELSEQQTNVLRVNRSFGINAGYTVSFPTVSTRNKGAISLAARSDLSQAAVDAIWAEHGREISLMNNVAHLKVQSLPYSNSERELTSRQREVLEWVGDGKTIQDIAVLIERTPATVEKHLRLARDAMNVETTAQALLKASFMKQIYLLEVPK
ncbi:LuxR family transcriptional regulator [Shimia haliotis]|uniref:LuxR family transcriptional regulator n=1 Tax=Shimia haliotis TaxID=1280847 RepID=A0A1I4AYT5_9RHOB|nr:LuxR family transcriptional regulator [Shimia haliotis]SFK61604.1 LuxR family transcriptional regulator [Shimia haliotis]